MNGHFSFTKTDELLFTRVFPVSSCIWFYNRQRFGRWMINSTLSGELNPPRGPAVNGEDETVCGAGHGTTEGQWDGGLHEPTCTWRSNILPLAHTGQWRSRHGGTWASCHTRPAASGAAGSGGWWHRSRRGSRSGWGTAWDPKSASSGTHRHGPGTPQIRKHTFGYE